MQSDYAEMTGFQRKFSLPFWGHRKLGCFPRVTRKIALCHLCLSYLGPRLQQSKQLQTQGSRRQARRGDASFMPALASARQPPSLCDGSGITPRLGSLPRILPQMAESLPNSSMQMSNRCLKSTQPSGTDVPHLVPPISI